MLCSLFMLKFINILLTDCSRKLELLVQFTNENLGGGGQQFWLCYYVSHKWMNA
jgi:hypothetical protein